MSRYRDDAEAVRALVREDCVHRDVYLSPAIFELEMRHLWRNTWIYVGHDSQVPNAGDYYTTELARQPVIMLRDAEGGVRVLMNRCAHKGAKLVSARRRSLRGRVAALPVSRLDLPARRLGPDDPDQVRLRGHGTGDVERGRRRGPGAERRDPSRLRVRAPCGVGPRLPRVLRRRAELDRQHGRPLAARPAGGRRRHAPLHARQQLEDVRREPERHDAPDGVARVGGGHGEEALGGTPRGRTEADGDRAVPAVRQRLRVLRQDGRADLRQWPQLLGCALLDPLRSTLRSASTSS